MQLDRACVHTEARNRRLGWRRLSLFTFNLQKRCIVLLLFTMFDVYSRERESEQKGKKQNKKLCAFFICRERWYRQVNSFCRRLRHKLQRLLGTGRRVFFLHVMAACSRNSIRKLFPSEKKFRQELVREEALSKKNRRYKRERRYLPADQLFEKSRHRVVSRASESLRIPLFFK